LKKTKVLIIISLLLVILSIAGYLAPNVVKNSEIKPSSTPEIKVVTTTTILWDFAQHIVGNLGTVDVIIEGGTCPGHYDYTPSDIVKVSDADIVFYHGFEWSQFLEDLLTQAGNLKAAYSMSGNASLGWTQWGAPANAILFLDAICAELNKTYPSLNETFNQNCLEYKNQILVKKAEIEANNAAIYNFTDVKAYIMFHQKAFITWLGFNITGEWTVDDNSMTPSDFANIIDGAYKTNTQIIIMNYQSGTVQGKAAADYLGIASAALLNFPGVYGVKTYLDQLDFNVAMLNWALNNGPDPRGITETTIGINLIGAIFAFSLTSISIITYKMLKKEKEI